VRFADTNVLLYAISTDPREEDKASVASAILEQRDIVLSAQVLQEFYVQATRHSRSDRLTPGDAAELVETLRRFPVVTITAALVSAAMTTHRRFDISYWDAAILEAARSAGCDLVLSEDLGDGVDYGGIRVQNPFRPSGSR
jgi:predicted nucleic acid-binding protein